MKEKCKNKNKQKKTTKKTTRGTEAIVKGWEINDFFAVKKN